MTAVTAGSHVISQARGQGVSYTAQIRTKWDDLLNWEAYLRGKEMKLDFEEHRTALAKLQIYLGDGVQELSQVKENMGVLAVLLASEIWIKEGNLNFEFGTTFEAFHFLEASKVDKAVEALPDTLAEDYRKKLVTKARNLQKAASVLFDVESIEYNTSSELSFPFIQDLHRRVVKDLDISSDIRTCQTAPAHTGQVYVLPKKIASRLEELLSFVNEKMATTTDLEERILLASLFFCEFLKIHPFRNRNGNGRTARLLLSWLLRADMFVPVSLTTDRDVHMEAVAHGQWSGSPPYKLAAQGTQCVALSSWNALDLFADENAAAAAPDSYGDDRGLRPRSSRGRPVPPSLRGNDRNQI